MNIKPNRSNRPGAAAPPSVQTAAPPQVVRKRSGRWPILLLLVFGALGWWIWDSFLRTSAYAIVEVDEVQVSSPLAGLIESMAVQEGGEYEAGTLVFTIVDKLGRDELETLQLQLRLVESKLEEKTVSSSFDRSDYLYERDDSIAKRRAELGEALFDQADLSAKIARLSASIPLKEFDLQRVEELAKQGVGSELELVEARTGYEAAKRELESLIEAQRGAISRVEALRLAVDRPVPNMPSPEVGIEPLRREAELLRRRIEQVHERLLQSVVRLTSSGRVLNIHHHPGEYIQAGVPILTLAQSSTVRVVAYFEQNETGSVDVNSPVRVLSSYAPESMGRVLRVGPSLEMCPEPIARFYTRGEPLLPVEVEVDSVAAMHLVPGSIVRVLPSRGSSIIQEAHAK